MAKTGVLPFLRGVDLSDNDFSGNSFPKAGAEMSGLRWMKLNRVGLDRVPDELSTMTNLEHFQMIGNNLSSVHGEISDMPNLRSVILRHNAIKTSGIPGDVFDMDDLTVLDFSHNSLKECPQNLDHAVSAIVLNLSHNSISQVPNSVFVNLQDLLHLDLSHNQIDMLPPQIRRLTELQHLALSHNPLLHFQLKQLPSMASLRVLHMAATQRNSSNVPPTLDNLVNLQDVDFSDNQLSEVPDALFKLTLLRKLNLAGNEIQEVTPYADPVWEGLECLNLSRNSLAILPEFIVRLPKLIRLYISFNHLTFDGIPASIGKMLQLQVLHLSYNRLELIPEGICRCVKLQRLKLNGNRLVTLPASVHLLPDLKELDVRNNPQLVMPPKPSQHSQRSAYYNIDFSLEAQKKAAGQATTSSSLSSSPAPSHHSSKDPIAKKIQYMRRRKAGAEADSDQQRILQGFQEVAKKKEEKIAAQTEIGDLKPQRWDAALAKQKPAVDYSEIFDVEEVGQEAGLEVWEMENFLPNPIHSSFHGHFYEEDSYIVLKTTIKEDGNKDWQIWYWIGEKTSLDKKACAAIHAVNLRNLLGASCRTIREEQNDESEEFMDVFGGELCYVEGGRTTSGFFTVEPTVWAKRLFRVHPNGQQIHLEPVAASHDSLDPRFVMVLDTGMVLYVWCGRKSKALLRSKARLFSEKVNKTERKGDAEIELLHQDSETEEFWSALVGKPASPSEPIVEHVPADFTWRKMKMYQVCLGMGYLELPQLDVGRGQLKQAMLQSKCVYVLDGWTEVWLWLGGKSTRLLRAAGSKLAAELHAMLERPSFAVVSCVKEGVESMMFKSRFIGWDDVLAVDYTRTAESVQRRGADLQVIMEKDKLRTDLGALFLERQEEMSTDEAEQLMEECNEDLELMEPFVLEGKKFVRLPEHEFGIFYTMDCYVFLCRYWVPPEEEDDNDEKKSGEEGAEPPPDDFQCVVYFWQGRDANNMGWLTFTFSLRKKFESLFKDKLEVVRMHQQQENQKFLSHFKKRLVVRRGRRCLSLFPSARKWPELFHVRANGSPISTRAIQIDCDSSCLNSAFCFILKIPYEVPEEDGSEGKILVWHGSKASQGEKDTAVDVAENLLNAEEYPLQIVDELEEPEEFWQILAKKKDPSKRRDYPQDADFMRHIRLFRCTNEKGFFAVSEKTIDFCQEDLDDDDVMILDNGVEVFLWLGSRASEVEIKLAYKAAQVYIHHLKASPDYQPRKLCATVRGRETKRFSKCFHAWGKHKTPAGD